jgi:hypothetical protein
LESENEDMHDGSYQLPAKVLNQAEDVSMSGTEKSVADSKLSVRKTVKDNQESLVTFFQIQIKNTEVS